MGKRVQKKDRGGMKEKRVSTPSSKAAQKENKHTSKIVNEEIDLENERKVCSHFEKAVNVAKVISKLESAESNGCEDCRENMIDCKDGKGKGKHGRKKASSKATWICLHCGHFSCGGVGLPNSRQTHAVQHASQNRHPLVIQLENPNLRWCFFCRSRIPVDKVDGNGEQNDVLSDVVKLLKKQCSETTLVDESVTGNVNYENDVVGLSNGMGFYAVRGLANLGNTCFFNSVMQNLLAIDMLRDYLLTFDRLMGPLTSALKSIYVETRSESGVRNVINPQPLFRCICARSSQFRGFEQQDSHELLRCLLDLLSTEDSRTKKSDKSSRENVASLPASPTFIDAFFGGQISSMVCCVECGHSSVVHETFLDLSLPLPAEKPAPKKSRTKKTKPPPKKAGKNRPKVNKDTDLHPTVSAESSSILNKAVLGCSSSADHVDSWLDYLEPACLSDDRKLSMKNEHGLIKQDFGRNDVNYNIDSLQTAVNSSEEIGDEDTSDFVGLGDLFDELKSGTTRSSVSDNMEGSVDVRNVLRDENNTGSVIDVWLIL
ncbi:hypothetical protein RND81_14G051100 [Saponaria officinalis]|uniref:ubiquitinyl hydrolase 1 n=1 Tax=Saponaria officinalis TaxID=3572 RepID=A0AAW1GLL9_SAPOF